MIVETKTTNDSDDSVGFIESIFESSNILKTIYFPKKEMLYISFNSGDTYSYRNIPQELFDEFLSSDSQGKFFVQKIRKENYPYRKEFKLKQYELDEINEIISNHKKNRNSDFLCED